MNREQNEALINAQFLLESFSGLGDVLLAQDLEQIKQFQKAIDDVIGAALYLVQFARTGCQPENYEEIVQAGMRAAVGDEDEPTQA